MNFKIGDKIRFKVTKEEWMDWFFNNGYYTDEDQEIILYRAKSIANGYKAPLTISRFNPDDKEFVVIKDATGMESAGSYEEGWFVLVEKAKQEESLEGYRETTDGFITKDENWVPGKWLI